MLHNTIENLFKNVHVYNFANTDSIKIVIVCWMGIMEISNFWVGEYEKEKKK